MRLELLEVRENPAAVDLTRYAAGFEPIPGWTGPVVSTVGDFDGNGSIDTAYAAGTGGGPRVQVYSGGRPNESPVPVTGDLGPSVGAGESVVQPPGAGDVIADFFAFEVDFRGGADITTIADFGPAPDRLVMTPGAGGGPRVRVMTLDGKVDFSFMAFEETYRGGLYATPTTVAFDVPAGDHHFGTDLLVMPRAGGGGGPVVAAFDVRGRELARFAIGPADDRTNEYRLLHADVDLIGHPGHRGAFFTVTSPDGAERTVSFDWGGQRYN